MLPKRSIHAVLAFTLIAAGAAIAAPAAQELEEFLGAWELTMQMQGEEVTIVLTFLQAEDGALSGTWESPRGAAELKDLEYEDGKLTFTRQMGGGQQGGAMANEATLVDGVLHLKMTTPRGERELTGKRKEG